MPKLPYLFEHLTWPEVDQAAADLSYPATPHFWGDLLGQKPDPSFKNALWMTEYWSVDSRNGVKGDPTKATAEKGRAVIEAGGRELVEIVRELRARPIRPRTAHQSQPPEHPWIAPT